MLYKTNSGSKTNNKSKPNKPKWCTIKEFPNYMVSDNGEVYNKITQKLMNKNLQGKYYTAGLSSNGKKQNKLIHILVARAFINNPKKLPKVDHKDNNRLNNIVSNLRWFTQSNNILSYHRNFRNYTAILQYDKNNNFIKKWKNTTEIIEQYPQYNRKTINHNLCKTSKSAYGYIWIYEKMKENKITKLRSNEMFKNIDTFEENDLSGYDVSNYGTICNKRGMILSPHIHDSGHMVIWLTDTKNIRKAYRIHRLVAHVFISQKIRPKDVVNHLDEDKTNNYYKNLEWITQKNNVIYSIGKKIKIIDPETNNILIIFGATTQACRYLGMKSHSKITDCCMGRIKTAFSFKWEYLKEDESLDTYKNNDDVFVYDLE